MDAVGAFRGAAHDVSVHVTASSQRRKLRLIDAIDRFPQIVFQNAVELQASAAL